MLNWIAIWVGTYLFGDGGPLQNAENNGAADLERRRRRARKLPVFWGDQDLQGLHIGFFVALAALVVFWLAPQPDDARLRGARGRLQPRGGGLRRHQRARRT